MQCIILTCNMYIFFSQGIRFGKNAYMFYCLLWVKISAGKLHVMKLEGKMQVSFFN